ncbi:MAG: guanylate kinase [Pirellulaceae bacterium]|nr:guanylate kinase [Pirellulaceae bacterium]
MSNDPSPPTETSPGERTLRGRLIVISGPSGAGKSTVVRELLKRENCPLPLVLSVSATTRQPRPGEIDGVNYFFLSHDEFARRRTASEFLECSEVFGRGDWYGTLQSQVTTGLAAGKWVILEIDVEGALTVMERSPDCITIFLHSGSLAELERRLRLRNTESEASIQRRLEVAQRELALIPRYRYEVVNRDIPEAVREICSLLSQYAKDPPCSTH